MLRFVKVASLVLLMCTVGTSVFADSSCSTSTPGVGGTPGATVSVSYDPSTGTVTIGVTGIANSIQRVYERIGNGNYTNVTSNDGDASGGTYTNVDSYLFSTGADPVFYKVIVKVDDTCWEIIYRFNPDVAGEHDTTVTQVGTPSSISCP